MMREDLAAAVGAILLLHGANDKRDGRLAGAARVAESLEVAAAEADHAAEAAECDEKARQKEADKAAQGYKNKKLAASDLFCNNARARPEAAYGGPSTAGKGAVEALRPPGRPAGAGQGGHGGEQAGPASAWRGPPRQCAGRWTRYGTGGIDKGVRRMTTWDGEGGNGGGKRGEGGGRAAQSGAAPPGRQPAGAVSAGGASTPPATTSGTWAPGPACRAAPASSQGGSWTGSGPACWPAACPTAADAPFCSADTPAVGSALPATAPAHNPGRDGARRRNVHPGDCGQRGGPVRGNLQVGSRLGQGHDAGSMQGRR